MLCCCSAGKFKFILHPSNLTYRMYIAITMLTFHALWRSDLSMLASSPRTSWVPLIRAIVTNAGKAVCITITFRVFYTLLSILITATNFYTCVIGNSEFLSVQILRVVVAYYFAGLFPLPGDAVVLIAYLTCYDDVTCWTRWVLYGPREVSTLCHRVGEHC